MASHPPLCLWTSLRLTFAPFFIIIFHVAHDVRAWDKPVLHICSAQRTFVARRDHLSSVSTFVVRLVFGCSILRPSNLGSFRRFPSSECARKKGKCSMLSFLVQKIEFGAVQKCPNLVGLKDCKNVFSESASKQPRTSPPNLYSYICS